MKNSGDRYWNVILHIKETVIRVKKKHCDVSSCMYYLKFTFEGPEYTRNMIFFDDSLVLKILTIKTLKNWGIVLSQTE